MSNSSIASLSRAGCLALTAANSALEPAYSAPCDIWGSLRQSLTGRLELTTVGLVAGHGGVRPAGTVDGPGKEVGPRGAHRQSAARLVAANRVSHDLGSRPKLHAAVRLLGWPGRLAAVPQGTASRITEPLR